MQTIKTTAAGDDEALRAAREKKNALSLILEREDEVRKWNDIREFQPDPGVPVVIRYENREIIYAEDDDNIIYAEDEKVARCSINENGEVIWTIEPPHLKYDFSPLINGDKLSENTVVTHWDYISDEELDAWIHRLDPVGDYAKLHLSVSSDYEELVYRSLINGANLIARSVNGKLNVEGNELQTAMYGVLTDLQMCIDHDVHISRGDMIKNHHAKIHDIPQAMAFYELIREECKDDRDRISIIIDALAAIDDDPERFYQMMEDGEGLENDPADDTEDVDEE